MLHLGAVISTTKAIVTLISQTHKHSPILLFPLKYLLLIWSDREQEKIEERVAEMAVRRIQIYDAAVYVFQKQWLRPLDHPGPPWTTQPVSQSLLSYWFTIIYVQVSALDMVFWPSVSRRAVHHVYRVLYIQREGYHYHVTVIQSGEIASGVFSASWEDVLMSRNNQWCGADLCTWSQYVYHIAVV